MVKVKKKSMWALGLEILTTTTGVVRGNQYGTS